MAYIAGVLRGANIRTGTPAVKSEFHVKRRAEVTRETQLAWGTVWRTGAPTRRAAASALSRSPSCADRWATRREFALPADLPYPELRSLATEARQKLERVRPTARTRPAPRAAPL